MIKNFILNLLQRFAKPTQATLAAIYISPLAGEPMQLLTHAALVKHKGIVDDRYYSDSGFWKVLEACQVTLITDNDIQYAVKRAPTKELASALLTGAHRRNLVIKGMKTKQLIGKKFQIGGAIFHYKKPRPPCGYIDKVSLRRMCFALGKKSGCCIEVIKSGQIQVGDQLHFINKS